MGFSMLLVIIFNLKLIVMLTGLLALTLVGLSMVIAYFLVALKKKKQSTVSCSSTEAEYRSIGTTVCELQWITYLLQDFNIPLHLPIPLWCDNQAALQITANPVFHEKD